MLKFVLDLFFPPCCCICEKLNSDWICENCKDSLYKNKKLLIKETLNRNYKYFCCLFFYKDIRNIILKFKFAGKAYFGNMFATLILEDKSLCNMLKKYDSIIPVPMTRNKKSIRGYNQTEIIANKVSKELKIEYISNCLVKIKDNKTQSTLSEKERFLNVQNIFDVKNIEKIKNKNVIIFDDIFTTGATVEECAKCLKNVGVNDILILTLAKD